MFFSRPSPKAGRELQTELDRRRMMDEGETLSEKSAGAGHRAVSLHRDCVLVYSYSLPKVTVITIITDIPCYTATLH